MSVFDDMVEFLDSAWCAKDQIVPCLQGPVGIGKTAAVLQHAENVKAGKVVTIIASQILPNEVSGITMPNSESRSMEIYDHFRLSSLEDGDILFFDELLEADQLVLSACLTLIESRQLMSGSKLPDVQIVAATNPTIQPNMLKENIRQRFVFREFWIDKVGCRDYIKKQYGIDVGDLVDKLESTGDEYNILTPRSLTKMAYWMSLSKTEDEAKRTAKSIDAIWNMRIGFKLLEAWMNKNNQPKDQLYNAIVKGLEQTGLINDLEFNDSLKILDKENFKDASMTELMDILKGLPDWKKLEAYLSTVMVEESEVESTVGF